MSYRWTVNVNEWGGRFVTYQLQYRNFHHTLVEVGWLILDNLDSHNLMSFHILTFDNLSESPLTEDIENEVPSSNGQRKDLEFQIALTYFCPSSLPNQSFTYRI